MHESLIMALRFCASGEKFPRLCTESCPLYCANGNADTCTACIDSLLRQAAEALEKAEERRSGHWEKGGYACGETEWKCSVCGETEWRTSCKRMKFCMFCGARMEEKEERKNDHQQETP